MNYRIYSIEEPSSLKQYDEVRGRNENLIVLKELPYITYPFSSEHETIKGAMADINAYKDNLKGKVLTIIPIIKIGWDGEIEADL